ncbi:MAG: PilZ domain-containing protein [Cyanobacteriota bacterium]
MDFSSSPMLGGATAAPNQGGATSSIPRREHRSPVPALSVAIQVDFLDGTQKHTGRLWDFSCTGACVWIPYRLTSGTESMQPGCEGEVVIHHPSDPLTIPVAARLVWVDIQPRATYAGFRFLGQNDFSNTFLRLLIRG